MARRPGPGPLPAGDRAAAQHRAHRWCSATAATRCSTAASASAQLVAFNVYIVLLIWPLRMLGMIIAQGQRAAASAQRVHEVLVTEPGGASTAATPTPPAGATDGHRGRRGALRGRRPSATSAGGHAGARPASTSTSRRASRSRSSGRPASGKSTVARLHPRFYDVDAGRVLLDGVDVRDARAGRSCAGRSGIVFEDTFLFSDTIAANIAFADPEADRRPDRAARPAWPAPTTSSSSCPTATTP